VRQVGADHEKRALIQHRGDDRGDLRRFGVAYEQRDESERSEHGLQEGQLDFERVFGRVCPIVDADKPCLDEQGDSISIERDLAERRGKSRGGGGGNAAHRNVMGGADQQHAPENGARCCDRCEGTRRNRSEYIACVRGDDAKEARFVRAGLERRASTVALEVP
jgi:hypothetical protein